MATIINEKNRKSLERIIDKIFIKISWIKKMTNKPTKIELLVLTPEDKTMDEFMVLLKECNTFRTSDGTMHTDERNGQQVYWYEVSGKKYELVENRIRYYKYIGKTKWKTL